ncbi:hypothetical protein BCR44DRAFT_1435801 [Catenaria anguillulae PL171]|uniref:Uncharacterized protein n=1 Tax=Catenaria anguillulae PL171 TaxID=765915 RepID=A0A1Y2HJN3_9FUNG|nr:hypothetical protein BCR44DRAFT_1435801 [Catenaria anguillulae PL171]
MVWRLRYASSSARPAMAAACWWADWFHGLTDVAMRRTFDCRQGRLRAKIRWIEYDAVALGQCVETFVVADALALGVERLVMCPRTWALNLDRLAKRPLGAGVIPSASANPRRVDGRECIGFPIRGPTWTTQVSLVYGFDCFTVGGSTNVIACCGSRDR